MYCPKCGCEVGNAKFCPECGAMVNNDSLITPEVEQPKPKKKIYKKWWFWVIIIILISSVSSNSNSTSNNYVVEDKSSETNIKTPTPAPSISYTKYDVTQLFDDLNSNAMKAQSVHEGEYAEITGYISVIDASGEYISVGAGDNYNYFLDSVLLNIKNASQREKIMNMVIGQHVTVKCKITSVGEILGYSADIIEIA